MKKVIVRFLILLFISSPLSAKELCFNSAGVVFAELAENKMSFPNFFGIELRSKIECQKGTACSYGVVSPMGFELQPSSVVEIYNSCSSLIYYSGDVSIDEVSSSPFSALLLDMPAGMEQANVIRIKVIRVSLPDTVAHSRFADSYLFLIRLEISVDDIDGLNSDIRSPKIEEPFYRLFRWGSPVVSFTERFVFAGRRDLLTVIRNIFE